MNKGKPSVLLINPTFNVHEHYGKLSDAASLLLPVSLLYLGGMLESKGAPVRIMDKIAAVVKNHYPHLDVLAGGTNDCRDRDGSSDSGGEEHE